MINWTRGRAFVFLLTGLTIAANSNDALANSPEPRVFERIDIRGNDRFRDADILATSGLRTGIALGQSDLEAAYEALQFTGEFRDVEIRSAGSTLIIDVTETSAYSGGLTFGAGFDTDTGAFGAIGFVLNDVGGRDAQVRGNLVVSEDVQTLGTSVRSPHFWGDQRRGGVRLNFGNFEYDNVTYQYRFGHIEPYVQLDVTDTTQLELRYTLAERRVSDVSSEASAILQAETGSQASSGVGFTLATQSGRLGTDTLGSWYFRLDQDFTGVGGDTTLSTTQVSFGGTRSIGTRGFAVRTRVALGAVAGFDGDSARVSERFTLGGAQLRGFERGTVSPRDVCAGCAADGGDVVTELGGNYFAVARTDLLVPLFPQAPDLETFVFFDVGSVWGVDTAVGPSGILNDEQTFRNSAGIGTSFDTQLGQFEAYLALHTDGVRQDDIQEFGLTFRSEF